MGRPTYPQGFPGLGRSNDAGFLDRIKASIQPLPPPKMEIRQVRSLDGRLKVLEWVVARSIRSPIVRGEAVWLVSTCPDRSDGCEVAKIFTYVKANVRYTQDIIGIDTYQAAQRTLQFKGGDCFPAGTLVLTDDFRFVPVEFLTAGTRIWGLNNWTKVERVWEKGVLPLDAIQLNNGSWVRLTRDHHVHVAYCDAHEELNARVGCGDRMPSGRLTAPCFCPMSERTLRRVSVGDLRIGDVMPAPERLPFGRAVTNPDTALMDGLYLSDGWVDDGGKHHLGPQRFCISGKDGFPKEAQKREVQAICERLGVDSRWDERYIAVNDREWAGRMALLGGHSYEKHALSIDLDEGGAGALLRGIMADSGANSRGQGRTFTTTSKQLALQVRVLHKMFGMSCGASYIEDHGGLGMHPIWRLTTKTAERKDGKAEKLLRVKAIEHDVVCAPTYDLTTEDHFVYLPEADVTVGQCDDHTVLLCALLSAVGFQTGFRVISTTGQQWEHIFALVGLPKKDPKSVLPLDTTVPSSVPGWEPPKSQVRATKDMYPLKLV